MYVKKIQIKHFVLLLILLVLGIINIQAQKAKTGLLDLSNFKFDESTSFDLDGVWEFYPYKFYSPSDFDKGISDIPKFVTVPSLWSNVIFPDSKTPNIGYGTYRLKIKVPDSINYFALRLKRIESSYKVWANEKLLTETGKVGIDKKTSEPQQKTVTEIFYTDKDTVNLIIQVCNFEHRKGGIANSIIFGTAPSVLKETKTLRGYEMFLTGVLLIMAFFHLGLYVVRKKDYSLLFFALLLLTEVISLATNGETFLTLYFPDLKWITLKRIDYISNFARITFFALFFYQAYKEYINRYFVYTVSGLSILLSVFVLFTNLQTFAFTLFIFIGMSAVTLFYVLYAQIKAVTLRKAGSLIPFIGTLILLFTAVNDILVVSGILNFIYLVPAGLFAFIFAQSYLLSFNFSKLYKETEELNKLISDADTIKNELLKRKSFNLNESLEILCKNIDADRAFLFGTGEKNSEVILLTKFPEQEKTPGKDYPALLIKEVLKNGKSKIISKTSGNKYFPEEYIGRYDINSSVTVPLIVSGKTEGIIHLERKSKKNVFTRHESRVLEELGTQIKGLVENAALYEETQNIKANLEKIIAARTADVKNQQDLAENQKAEIESINDRLKETLEEVKAQNDILTESIKSAKLIQKSVLPDRLFLNSLFSDIFVLYRPKEIVSGDFYYAYKTKDEKIIFALADCTGHGVPGVLMSLIGYDMMSNAFINKGVIKPSLVLEQMRKDIVERLGRSGEEGQDIKDGMDTAVINFDPKTLLLEYAGAKIDLLILRNNKLTEVKADKLSVSAERYDRLKDKNFRNYKIQLKKGDILYLATDGFQDQFGGENDTKFMKKNFRALLAEIGDLQFNIQRSRLLKTLNRWQGDKIQNDDITVIGIKI